MTKGKGGIKCIYGQNVLEKSNIFVNFADKIIHELTIKYASL